MEFLLLGFFTSLSLILAIGAQNIFVIEQGLKKQYTFIVCFICSISDCFLIFIGIFLFNYFNQYFTLKIEIIFNILLVVFLIYFIYSKIKLRSKQIDFNQNFRNFFHIIWVYFYNVSSLIFGKQILDLVYQIFRCL